MTEYTEKTVLDAFDLYSKLAAAGSVPKAENAQLYSDEDIRSLAQRFAAHVGCTIIDDADKIYLIPVKPDAMFHILQMQLFLRRTDSMHLPVSSLHTLYSCIRLLQNLQVSVIHLQQNQQ